MGPESIRKLAETKEAVRKAERDALHAEVEAAVAIEDRVLELRSRVHEQNFTIVEQDIARQKVYGMLFRLLRNLWETEVDGVGEVQGPDAGISSKQLIVPEYPVLRLRQRDNPQTKESGIATDMYGLSTNDYSWHLRTSTNVVDVSIGEHEQKSVIDSPLMQTYYEDDVDTLAGIYTALQIPLPKEVTAPRI